MEVEKKLEELRAMHEKGLISSTVYEEQQRLLLSQHSADSAKQLSNERKASASSFLDPRRNLRVIVKLGVLFVVLLFGIWLVYHLSDQETKDTLSQFASQTGVGTQVIPWRDRADTAARRLVEMNKVKIAEAIQGIAHPTGSAPVLHSYNVSKLPDRVVVEIVVNWKGGLSGASYSTAVSWEIGERNHIGAKVSQDSALVSVDPKNREVLDEYFRTKVYPAFLSDLGG